MKGKKGRSSIKGVDSNRGLKSGSKFKSKGGEEMKLEDDYEEFQEYLKWKKAKDKISRNHYSEDPMGLETNPMKTSDTVKMREQNNGSKLSNAGKNIIFNKNPQDDLIKPKRKY